MTPTPSTVSIVNVPLTARDIQWLAVVDVMIASLLDGAISDEQVDLNAEAVERMYMLHDSSEEACALRDRIRALLPRDAPLTFVAPQFPLASVATLPS